MVKIALVNTGFTPQMMEAQTEGLTAALPDRELEFRIYANAGLINESLAHGQVTKDVARRLFKTFFQAVEDGAEVVFSACSTMGDIAEAVKPAFALLGIPFIRVDEDMMLTVVKKHARIAFFATVDTIFRPSRNLMDKCLAETGSQAKVTDFVIPEAFGQPHRKIADLFENAIRNRLSEFDCAVLTQGSFQPVAEMMEAELGIPVYCAINYGIAATAKAIRKAGLR